MKINFSEIKKWLWAAGGMLGLILTGIVDFVPEDWKPVVAGILAVLSLIGVYQAKGPTPGTPVFQRSTGRHAKPDPV